MKKKDIKNEKKSDLLKQLSNYNFEDWSPTSCRWEIPDTSTKMDIYYKTFKTVVFSVLKFVILFTAVNYFHPHIIFAGKAGPSQLEPLTGLHIMAWP